METRNRSYLQSYAMLYGTYMGLFWILKFPLFPIGIRYPFFLLIYATLTVAVPFLGYYYARQYRDRVCGGSIRFINAWVFLLLIYMFAALLTAVCHYIYFSFFDKGFIFNTYDKMIDEMNNPIFKKYHYAQAKAMIREFESLTPIKITLQLISTNVFYGNILALITAPFVMKKK